MAKPTRLDQEMINDYIARGLWDHIGITDLLKHNASTYPEREALVDSGTRLTWSELDRVTDRAALGLIKLGMKRGGSLVAQLPTSATNFIILLACQKAGILTCFPPMTFRHKELKHILKTLRAAAVVTPLEYRGTSYYRMVREIAPDLDELKYLIVSGNDAPEGSFALQNILQPAIEEGPSAELPQGRPFNPFEVCMVVLSSGTTGMPKCIEETGASSKAGGRGVVERAKLTHDDVIGNIAPISGGPGLQNWWAGFQVGAKTCLLEHFSPQGALQLIEEEKVTYLTAIPAQLIKILKECDLSRYDLSSLRVVRTGASAFDAAMARETEERMHCTVLIAGGSQETYSFAQTGVDDPPEKRLMTLGRPFPGNEIKICNDRGDHVPRGEVGQLFVRGAATSSGYYADAEATLAAWGRMGIDGWYGTGDLAKLDDDGYLVIVGRKKEIIIRGGQNIYPREIEELLISHPHIMQAVVLGIPDAVMGERACACITVADGQAVCFEEIISFLKEKQLAVHKLPERLEIMDQFPQLVDGQKIDKITLKRMVMDKMAV